MLNRLKAQINGIELMIIVKHKSKNNELSNNLIFSSLIKLIAIQLW